MKVIGIKLVDSPKTYVKDFLIVNYEGKTLHVLKECYDLKDAFLIPDDKVDYYFNNWFSPHENTHYFFVDVPVKQLSLFDFGE